MQFCHQQDFNKNKDQNILEVKCFNKLVFKYAFIDLF